MRYNQPTSTSAAWKMMKTHLVALLLMFLYGSCKDEGVPPLPPHVSTVQLTMEEVGVTDVWLKVRFTDLASPRDFALRRGGTTVLSGLLTGQDTLLLDTSAAPGGSYSYVALRLNGTTQVDSSQTVTVRTINSTSHAFTFDVDTLGEGSGNYFKDAAIVSAAEVWVTGKINKQDSSGQIDPIPFNAAKWDGSEWNLLRIPFPVFCGTGMFPSATSTVLAFSSNDVWISSGVTIQRWNGTSYSPLCIPVDIVDGTINKMWGISNESVFCAGDSGTIVHYNGSQWQRMVSGTNINLHDVWGSPDGRFVWASGYTGNFSRSIFLEYNGQNWRTVAEVPSSSPPDPDSLSGTLTSAWTVSGRTVEVATSGGMYRVLPYSHGEATRTWLPQFGAIGLFHRVRGSGYNNIAVCGAFGTVVHYNGVDWLQFSEFFSLQGPNLLSLDCSDDMFVAVGYVGLRGIIVMGRR